MSDLASAPDRPNVLQAPHALDVETVLAALAVDPRTGIIPAERRRRRTLYGDNRLAETPPRPAWRRYADQFRSLLIGVLIGAAMLAAVVGDLLDAGVILLNATLGFLQERRAEAALSALRQMLAPEARVRVDGHPQERWPSLRFRKVCRRWSP